MKRIIFSVIISVIAVVFCVLYCVPDIRSFFVNTGVGFLATAYSELDLFFSFIWSHSFGFFIKLTEKENIAKIFRCIILVGATTVILILLIVIPSTIVYNVKQKNEIKTDYEAEKEKEKLKNIGKTPRYFSQFDPNNTVYYNNKTPYVDLSPTLMKDIASQEEKVDLSLVKYTPTARIIFSVLYFLILLSFIFLQFGSLTKYEWFTTTFSGLNSLEWYSSINDNLYSFFTTLFNKFYLSPMVQVGEVMWTWGIFAQLMSILLIGLLIWAVIMLIAHKVVKGLRQKKSGVIKADNKNKKRELSSKALSILGDADLNEVNGADVTSIAKLTKNLVSIEREKQLQLKAQYIDDIGEKVEDAGKALNIDNLITPSKYRKPLILEETPEDLSQNKDVKISDIASIEDSVLSNKSDVDVVEASYVINQNEDIPHLDLTSIDLGAIAIQDPPIREKTSELKDLDDQIEFDEDGFSYLVKQGKPFVDENEDISNVVDEINPDKNLLINRYGYENYQTLDSLEPFNLKEMNVEEEIKNARERQILEDAMANDSILKESLSLKPFNVINSSDKNKVKSIDIDSFNLDDIEDKKVEKKQIKPVAPKVVPLADFDKKVQTNIEPISTPIKPLKPVSLNNGPKPLITPVKPKIVPLEDFKGKKKN